MFWLSFLWTFFEGVLSVIGIVVGAATFMQALFPICVIELLLSFCLFGFSVILFHIVLNKS